MKKDLMILPIALVGMLLLFGCIAPPTGTEIEFETIEKSQKNSTQLEGGAYVISSQEKWQSFWNLLNSGRSSVPELPEIDFSEETVIAVLGGQKTGYGIEIEKISPDEVTIIVNFKDTPPNIGPDMGIPQVISYPYHIVKIPKQPTDNFFFTDGKNVMPIIDFEVIPEPTGETVWMSVEPIQYGNSWDDFGSCPCTEEYCPGCAPLSEEEKIKGFLASKGIEVLEYISRDKHEVVCQALSCPQGNEVLVKISAQKQTAIEEFGFTKVEKVMIFTEKLNYWWNLMPGPEQQVQQKIKITILNPTNENIYFNGCNQYSYVKEGETQQNNFKECVWEGNAFEIKAMNFEKFSENLLPKGNYKIVSGYSFNCNESLLSSPPIPVSELECNNSQTIESLVFRIQEAY